jgi:hypothetical protein
MIISSLNPFRERLMCLIVRWTSQKFAWMSKPGSESSRKWHPQQEELFLYLLSKAEFRLIGGKGDGVMERKDHARWAPLLSAISKGVAQFNANRTTSAEKS